MFVRSFPECKQIEATIVPSGLERQSASHRSLVKAFEVSEYISEIDRKCDTDDNVHF